MKDAFYGAVILALISYGAWGMDAHIEQKMGTIVDDQLDKRQIQYLEFQKKNRDLTEQEQRDLEYFNEQLRLRSVGSGQTPAP